MSDWVALRDALGLKLRPIDAWPGTQRRSRDRSPFSATLKDTLTVLKRELRELHGKNIVLQIAIREQDLRLDGLPRAGAVAEHPGVILAFDCKHGPLRLYFDRFTRWDHNLRAIAMHLADLRHSALYGVGVDGQQYKGWLALPAPGADEFATLDDAARWLSEVSGVMVTAHNTDREAVTKAYRLASLQFHPDRGGSHEQFVRLTKAVEMLSK